MKAFQMLDHVLLWVARVFAISTPAFVAYGIWGMYTDDDAQLLYKYDHRPIFSDGDLLFWACCAIWCGIWLICVWHIPTKITRTILGLSAGILAYWVIEILAVNSPIHTSIVLGIPPTIEDLAMPAWLVLVSLSMAWLAIRASSARPTNSVSSVGFNNSTTRHAIP